MHKKIFKINKGDNIEKFSKTTQWPLTTIYNFFKYEMPENMYYNLKISYMIFQNFKRRICASNFVPGVNPKIVLL